MRLFTYLRAWMGRGGSAQPVAGADPIAERLHAAVDANAHAEVHSSACYERRVHAMIDDLFLRMDHHGRR